MNITLRFYVFVMGILIAFLGLIAPVFVVETLIKKVKEMA